MGDKTVIFLCGLIGSGKTTYAIDTFEYFTDLDYMRPHSTKIDQINWTMQLLRQTDVVCHITCLPTQLELSAFRKFNREFLWMDTSIDEAKMNIMTRGRPRDMADLKRVFNVNAELLLRFQKAKPIFSLINNYRRPNV